METYLYTCFNFCVDQSMCARWSCTTKRGGLPHLTYEAYKQELLVSEFTITCGMTGCLLNLEIIRGCKSMRNQLSNKSYGHCTVLGLRNIWLERFENYKFTHTWKNQNNSEIEFEDENHRDDWMVQYEITDKQVVLGDSFFRSSRIWI